MSVSNSSLANVRNIGVIAHIDAGKTTVTDRILFYTGRTHRLGSVDEGTTVTDWMAQERERGITIVAAAISAQWRECFINLIDTPGHIDFTAEVQRSLRVLDGAIVVFDAVHGVQSQSETVWRQADKNKVPRLCFINKMDRLGADFAQAASSIEKRLGVRVACLQRPIGEESSFRGVIDLVEMRAILWDVSAGSQIENSELSGAMLREAEVARSNLVERIAEEDDEFLALYLSGSRPEPHQLRLALRRATLANRLFPVYCGAALRNIGVQPLLDGVVDFLPSPLDRGSAHGTDPDSGADVWLKPDDDETLAALVFKVVTDAYMGHLSYVRVYSGAIHSGMPLFNPERRRKERAGRLLRMFANHREEVRVIHAGDIGAILGLNHFHTGDTLCAESKPVVLERIGFSEPVIQATIEPRTSSDLDSMMNALRHLAEEDPTFRTGRDENTGQLTVEGMGELHLEVALDRLDREFGIKANMGKPRVTYKETITQSVIGVEGQCIRQTGGLGQYGHVILSMKPGVRGTGILIQNAVTGGAIPPPFIPAVEQGIRDAALAGVIAGYAVTDVEVRIDGGSAHPVDSSEMAFRIASVTAFRQAMKDASPALLEPVFRMEVLVPVEDTGTVLGHLAARRAEIGSVEPRPGGLEAIGGIIPLSETFGYVTELRSDTEGRGQFTMEFDHYSLVDPGRTKAIVSGSR